MNIDFNSWHPNQVHYENFRCRKLLGDEDFKKVKMPKHLLFQAQKWAYWQWSTIYRHSVDQKTYRACLWWWGRKKHAHNINICYFNLGKTNCHKNHFVSNFQFSNCTSPYMSSIGTFTSFGPHLIPNQPKVSIFSFFVWMNMQNN